MWRKTKREKAELLLAFTLKRKREVPLKHKTVQHTHYLVESSTRCTTLRLWLSVYMHEKMFNAYRKNLPSIRINKREREGEREGGRYYFSAHDLTIQNEFCAV